MKKILTVIACALCVSARSQTSTKMVFDMELFAFDDTIRFGARNMLPTASMLPQSIDTTLFLTKIKVGNVYYFTFFKQQPTTTGWLKVAQTPVIDNEIVDTVAIDMILEPFTKGPVITFARSKVEESGVRTRYFFEKYYLFFKRWEFVPR